MLSKGIMEGFKKVELHLHLDGSLRPETVLELLKDQYPEESSVDINEIKKLLSVEGNNEDLVQYLKKFDLPIKLLKTEQALRRVSYELVEDLAKEHTIYAEIRIAPIQQINENLSEDQFIEAILDGFNRAMSKYPIKVRLLLCAMRHLPPEDSYFLIDLVKKYRDRGVVGLDLAGDEYNYPASLFKSFFTKAKELNIPFTIHAGEARGHESIVEAINLGASRIGHGIRAFEDDNTMNYIRDKNICLECCPISNRDTKTIKNFKKYPILKYLNMGIAVTLNSDNRTVSNTNYSKEVEFLQRYLPVSKEHIKQFNINGINHGFINEEEKKELLAKL